MAAAATTRARPSADRSVPGRRLGFRSQTEAQGHPGLPAGRLAARVERTTVALRRSHHVSCRSVTRGCACRCVQAPRRSEAPESPHWFRSNSAPNRRYRCPRVAPVGRVPGGQPSRRAENDCHGAPSHEVSGRYHDLRCVHVPGSASIISHTHWDREWYPSGLPMRMAAMIDELIEKMELTRATASSTSRPAILFRDYLEIRPHTAPGCKLCADVHIAARCTF